MKLYGIRFAKGFQYGTVETVFRTQMGNRKLIPDFSFFYYLAEAEGKYFLIDTGFRDGRLAVEMGVSLLLVEEEIRKVFGSFPEIDAIFLTHSHWDHINNIDLYSDARLIMSKLTYENAVSKGTAEVKDRLLETKARIFRFSIFKRVIIPIVLQETNAIYVITWNKIFLLASVFTERKMSGLSGRQMQKDGYRCRFMIRAF